MSASHVRLRIEAVTKKYGPLTVLSDVDLDFRAGSVTAVIGPNAAGKSTLMKMILGLVRPDAGAVMLDGETVNGDAAYRASIAYMPQLPRFPANLTGHELIALLDDVRSFEGEPDEELVDEFGLRGELDKPFRTLSGGTRQKLNAALAFRYGCKILVLDEPTSGLDPVAIGVLRQRVLRERNRGATVLITSHDMGQLQALADQVVFLLEGRVRFAGALTDLVGQTGARDLEGAIVSLMTGGADPVPGSTTLAEEVA